MPYRLATRDSSRSSGVRRRIVSVMRRMIEGVRRRRIVQASILVKVSVLLRVAFLGIDSFLKLLKLLHVSGKEGEEFLLLLFVHTVSFNNSWIMPYAMRRGISLLSSCRRTSYIFSSRVILSYWQTLQAFGAPVSFSLLRPLLVRSLAYAQRRFSLH